MSKFIILVLFFTFSQENYIVQTPAKSSFQIVVNKSVKVTTISQKKLSKIYLKKIITWDDGRPILPVELNEEAEVRKKFTKSIFNKRVAAIKAYWQKQIFTGRDVPPPEKLSEDALLQYVENHAGAIGYLSASTSIKKYKVKVLSLQGPAK